MLIQEFGIDIVREDNKTITHSRRSRRMRLLRTRHLHHCPRRATPAPTPATTTSAPTAPPQSTPRTPGKADDERLHVGDTHTEGSNGIYGLTREARWAVDRIHPRLAGSVKESHIHLPEPNVDVCVSVFSASVYLLM